MLMIIWASNKSSNKTIEVILYRGLMVFAISPHFFMFSL